MSEDQFLTRRERLIRILLENAGRPMSPYVLASMLGMERLRDLYDELDHVARTLKRMGYRLRAVPPRCKSCGYEFRDRLDRPSRCPRCRSERIEPAQIYVE